MSVDLDVVSSADLAEESLEIALETGHPTYDGVYVALARMEGGRFVTADERMLREFAEHPTYGSLVVRLGAELL